MSGMSYYIYIKSDGGNGVVSPTKPRPERPTPTSPIKVVSQKSTPAAGNFLKAGVGIAVATKVLQTVNRTAEFLIPYFSRETGNYAFSRNVNNAHAIGRALRDPYQTLVSIIQQEQQIRLTNQRLEESRVLFGDSNLTKGMKRVWFFI